MSVPGLRVPWRALSTRNFRLYATGMLLSYAGTWMQRVALAWLVLDMTGSAVALAMTETFAFIPMLAFSLVSGALVDRFSRRRLLTVVVIGQAIQATTLAVLVLSGLIQLWQVYVLAALLGLLEAVEKPTRNALIGETVSSADRASAVGVNASMSSLGRVVGPSVSGLTIAWFGPGLCFALNAFSFLAVLLALLLMQPLRSSTRPRGAASPLLRQVGQGIRYAMSSQGVAVALLVQLFLGTFAFNFQVMLPLMARFELDSGPTGLGTLFSAMGVGAVMGSMVTAARSSVGTRTVIAGGTALALMLLVLSVAPSHLVAACIMVFVGFCTSFYNTSTQALILLNTRDEFRGRVLSLNQLLHSGSTPIGAALTGVLAQAWGVRPTLALWASICLLGIGLALLYRRRLGPESAVRSGGQDAVASGPDYQHEQISALALAAGAPGDSERPPPPTVARG